MRPLPIAVLGLLILSGAPAHAVRIEQDADYTLYDNILQSYVSADGLVDYMGLRANSLADLQTVLGQFAEADLSSMDYREKLAFWINAYNANLIGLIVNSPDLQKIDEHNPLFDKPLRVAKDTHSLNDIEPKVLRGLDVFDPRIHFALNTGNIGGPRLQNFAYTSKNLEQALRKNSSDFVNAPRHLRVENGRLYISELMNRHTQDFDSWGGPASYLNRLVDPKQRDDAVEVKRLLLTDYRKAEFTSDSTLNDIRHAATKRPKLLRSPK